MPALQRKHTPAGGSIGTSAETSVLVLDPVLTGRGQIGVVIHGFIIVSPGTGATGVTVRCRYGNGLTGAVVDTDVIVSGMTAGNRYAVPVGWVDSSNLSDQPGGTQYTISVIQTGAPTAAGTTPTGVITVED